MTPQFTNDQKIVISGCVRIVRMFLLIIVMAPAEGPAFTFLSSAFWFLLAIALYIVSERALEKFDESITSKS